MSYSQIARVLCVSRQRVFEIATKSGQAAKRHADTTKARKIEKNINRPTLRKLSDAGVSTRDLLQLVEAVVSNEVVPTL